VAVEEERCLIEFGVLHFFSEGRDALIEQTARPETALHGIADELENRESELTRDL
jgi:hypothetical protein